MDDGVNQDWPEPEPIQAPVPPSEFVRITQLDQDGPSAPASQPAFAPHHVTDAWPEPETRQHGSGDFTRANANEDTLALIAEKATLRNSRADWQRRDYGQWKPAPMTMLAPIVASLIAFAIVLFAPLATNLDVVVEAVQAAWAARSEPGQKMLDVFVDTGGVTMLGAFLAAAAALWHLRAALGVARGSHASLLSARAASMFWFTVCVLVVTEDTDTMLALTGPTAVLWAIIALLIAVFSLTWAKPVQQWCRKTLRAPE